MGRAALPVITPRIGVEGSKFEQRNPNSSKAGPIRPFRFGRRHINRDSQMNPELTWMVGVSEPAGSPDARGWMAPDIPDVRAVFDCLIWPVSLAFGRTHSVGCS